MNQLTFIDYLEIYFNVLITKTSKQGKIHLNSNTYIEITGNQSKTFESINYLWINEIKVGTIVYNPRTPVIPKNYVSIKFENEHLYSGEWLNYYTYIVNRLGFTYNQIKRVDITIDLVGNKIQSFINKYINTKPIDIVFNSHCNITYENSLKIKPITYHIGSLKSNKYIKVYNKSKELENSKKQYIKEFWKLNNLDYINNEIERFELTLQNEKAKGINLFLLRDSNYLNQVLETECKGYFHFTKTSKKGKRDVTPITFNYKAINNTLKYLKPEKAKKMVNVPESIKRSIKTLYKEHLHYNTDLEYKESICNTINELLCKHPYLVEYVNTKLPYWEKEYKITNN